MGNKKYINTFIHKTCTAFMYQLIIIGTQNYSPLQPLTCIFSLPSALWDFSHLFVHRPNKILMCFLIK